MAMAFDAAVEETDDALIARYAAGDQSAARVLAMRRTPRVLALANRMLGDPSEAEDVAQEAMLRLWRVAREWRPGAALLSTWLHRVAMNLCIDRIRRRRFAPLEEAAEPADPSLSARDRLETAERAAALRRAIDDLPRRQRRAIELRHFEELPNEETARIMQVSVEAVESLLARGRRALARALIPHKKKLSLN